ncbi:MAG: rhomboid family intramembrane serine protease [Mycobacteriales bacterium]
MRSASVGFQCPDDVAAADKNVRPPRTVFGGRVSSDTSRVSLTLIALNVLVFVAGLALGERELQIRFGNLAGPVFLDDGQLGGVAIGEYYRLLSAAFLHGGVLHLLMNMFALAQLGPVLESALGRSRFLALYLLSALAGSTLSFLLSAPDQLGVGASGAIFGLFGAYYVVVRRLGGETTAILALLAVNLVITFAVPIIDWRAHLGGLVAGAALAAGFAYAPGGPRRGRLHVLACVVLGLLLVAAVILRKATLSG